MTEHQLFVPTDGRGVQHYLEEDIQWPLPVPGAGAEVLSSSSAEHRLPLYTLEGLLEELGERIFVGEIVAGGTGGTGSGAGDGGIIEVEAARLVNESTWDVQEAARFALDCASHVLTEPLAIRLKSGASLEEVLDAARNWLDRSEGDAGLLGRISRIATARRLSHQSAEVGDVAFAIMLQDERSDLDAMEDPDWTTVAAVRDAVLAAVEALRHQALPQLFESENIRYEEDDNGSQQLPEPVDTPWGSFIGGRRAGVVPAWVAARDAASRARDAAGDANGDAAGLAERQWQLGRLRAGLGL